MNSGKIKKVIQERGYGFIRADDGIEVFFHMTDLQGVDFKDLKEADPMEFDVKKDPQRRGPRAVNVRRSSD